jgi:hypothetical protein
LEQKTSSRLQPFLRLSVVPILPAFSR